MEQNSRKRYCDRGQRWENPDRAKNQSDYRIRYRARLEKNEMFITGLGLTNYLYYLKFGLFLCYQSIFILYLLMTNLFDKQLKKKGSGIK